MALLYLDLLGMKSQWHAGGVEAARRRYREFSHVVVEGLEALPSRICVGGGVQSDAAALTFSDTQSAVIVGRAIFHAAFHSGSSGSRMWIRGLIVEHDWPPDASLEKMRALPGAPAGVFERHFKRPLLSAINLEQSGFRGQRLLIQSNLVTDELRASLAVPVAGRPQSPFRRLEHSAYPKAVEGFQDILWMLVEDPADWRQSQLHMLNLLRWSSTGGDAEMVQASATHLVFAQADAIRFGIANAPAWWSGPTDPHLQALWSRLCRTLAAVYEAR